jgi:hypothetical protein
MSLSNPDGTRWVIEGVDREAVRLAKELAVRHNIRIRDLVEEAIYHYDRELGRSIELPDGWTKPRDW